MTLNVSYKPAVLEGNGVIKEFSYSFNPISDEYLQVSLEQNGVWEKQISGWSATTSENGGVVTFDVAPTTRVAIERIIPQEQPTSYTTSSGFQAKVVENSFDILTGMVQQLQEESDRSVKVVVGDNQTPEELLAEVYGKLDSATDIAGEAILAAEQATIAAEQATTAVEEAKKQVIDTQEYVDQAKGEIDTIVAEAEASVDGAITQATEDVKQAALDAAQESINTAAAQATAIVVDYANNEVKPELQTYVDSSNANATVASNSADAAMEYANSASTSATNASASATASESAATRAETAATQSEQASGKIVQLGFDGAIEDGKLVFKHAPSGVEIPYDLLDNYEYEVDLLWNSEVTISQNTPMVIKNGSDTITFVSALHRSADEPATISDMVSVMREADGNYRWLFKAAYKITPAGKKVFLLYPVISNSVEKVDLDCSNISAEGKSLISGLGMPSDNYVDLVLTSGETYIAPANGFLSANGTASAAGGVITLFNQTSGIAGQSPAGTRSGYGLNTYIPAKSGDEIEIYMAEVNSASFRFVYAEGEI